jgi:hypothetical protein
MKVTKLERRQPRSRHDCTTGAPSFSSIALVTKSITDVSAVTQCNFSSRCSGFGMRVANWVHASVVSRAHGARLPRRTHERRTVWTCGLQFRDDAVQGHRSNQEARCRR